MAIFNRGGYWHYDFKLDSERYRGTTRIPASTKAVPANVKLFVKNLRERAALGEVSRSALTIEEAAGRWFAARADGKKSARTTAFRIEIMLRHIGRETLVPAIDEPAIEAAIQARRLEPLRPKSAKGVQFPANATVNHDLIDATLRPILRYAKKYLRQRTHDIDWNDLKLEQPKERIREFSADEMARWLAHMPAWHHPVHAFMERYGTRLAETFFAPSAFDGERVTIQAADRKNKRTHVIPILPEHRAELASRAARAKAAGLSTVWFRERIVDGEPVLTAIHQRGFQSASKKALGLAGIKDARPAHDLRHHAATMALRRSKNLGAVKRLLGHDNIQSTMRYAHSDETDVLEALGHVPHHNGSGAQSPPAIESKG